MVAACMLHVTKKRVVADTNFAGFVKENGANMEMVQEVSTHAQNTKN